LRIISLKAIFLAKNPHLKQFVNAQDNAIMIVIVSGCIIACFETTQRLAISK
jgi:hypothetical protein